MNKSRLHLMKDYFLAVLVTFSIASISHTQFVLSELIKVGADISFSTRVSASFQDFVGLLPSYAIVIAIGLLLGFAIASFIKSKLNSNHLGWYPLAGCVSLLTIHLAMHPILEITLIAGARTTVGLIMQLLAGGVGGLCFYYLRARAKRRNS